MKAVGVAGVSSLVAAPLLGQEKSGADAPGAANPQVPLRPFGKTGVKVPMLALGGIFDILTNQLVLQRALDFGITYWDTAHVYTNGNSEKGIGAYFEKHPEVRKRIFLVSKASGPFNASNLDAMLEESLGRMKTDYIDLYFLHGIGSAEALRPEVKTWAEKTKAANKIRFFGFSSHGNMDNTLRDAAKLGWVDGLMLKYDFRLMQADSMRSALDACEKAGIGITAMKTQGGGPIQAETEADLKLGGHFLKRGFTGHQAKVKAVWENQQIASICSQMGSISVLESNTAAALDKTKLTAADFRALHLYAQDTHSHYCAGCSHLCEAAVGNRVPVGDLMRCLMYSRVYGDRGLALDTWKRLPETARSALANIDCSHAEMVCPHKLPIGKLLREAGEMLA